MGREGAGLQEDARPQLGIARRGWLRRLSLSWRAPMRELELEKVPIGLPLPDMTMDQFMNIEDGWLVREDRV